jgi:hypothetical protein
MGRFSRQLKITFTSRLHHRPIQFLKNLLNGTTMKPVSLVFIMIYTVAVIGSFPNKIIL